MSADGGGGEVVSNGGNCCLIGPHFLLCRRSFITYLKSHLVSWEVGIRGEAELHQSQCWFGTGDNLAALLRA